MRKPSESGYPDFDSSNTEIIVVDGPWDTTVRPMRADLRRLIEEHRKSLENDALNQIDKTPPDQEPPQAN